MKKNLNEEVARMKEIMGLNEELVDLNTYNSDEDIIKNISLMEKLPNGNVLIDMDMSVFIPLENNQGLKHTAKIITEWDENWNVVKLKHVQLIDAEPNNKDIKMYWHILLDGLKTQIFNERSNPKQVMEAIYNPYYLHDLKKNHRPNQAILNAKRNNYEKLRDVLKTAFKSDVNNPIAQKPIENEPPQMDNKPEAPKKDGNSMWTSTTSWASE